MCPTPLGRVHTRVATITLPALLATALSVISGRPDWLVLIGVYLLLGVALDSALYSWALRYQPPWMTAVLAVFEFGLLLILADVLELQLSVLEASALYSASWLLAVATKIAILPIAALTYVESSTEFRHPVWSISPPQASMPLIASETDLATATAPGGLLDRASSEHEIPLERRPSLSGVQRAGA